MFQMLAKAYVKGERNMHFLITRSELRNWLPFSDPLDWRALLFWHSQLNKVICTPRRNSKFITGALADKKREEIDTDLQFLYRKNICREILGSYCYSWCLK